MRQTARDADQVDDEKEHEGVRPRQQEQRRQHETHLWRIEIARRLRIARAQDEAIGGRVEEPEIIGEMRRWRERHSEAGRCADQRPPGTGEKDENERLTQEKSACAHYGHEAPSTVCLSLRGCGQRHHRIMGDKDKHRRIGDEQLPQ